LPRIHCLAPARNHCLAPASQRLLVVLARCRYISLGRKPDTRTPNPKYPHPNLKNPNPQYPKSNSGSECYYPNLFRLNRVVCPGTRSTRTRNHLGSRRVIYSYYSAVQTANSVVPQPNESIHNLFSCSMFEPVGCHGLQYLLALHVAFA
jgi:hypothetical protein